MKTKIYSILLFATTLFICIFFSGCDKPDASCQTTFIYQNILPSERPAFIYKGYEKLTFIRHPQLDTLILIAGGLDSTYASIKGDQSDCPTLTEGQIFETIFKGAINTVKYTIKANIWKDNPNLVQSTMEFGLFVELANGAIIGGGGGGSSADFLNSTLFETDTINGKIYKDVLKALSNPPSYVLYSQVYGIIKIVNSNGEYLELLKKE
ncbi:MAG: hypothetical protein WCO28_05825 [Bacteroidota bacterium]